MSQYFPDRIYSRNIVKIELEMVSYARKGNLEKETGVETSSLAKANALATVVIEVCESSRLKTLRPDFGKLIRLVDHKLVKKTNLTRKMVILK